MDEGRLVISDELWQKIAPLLPGKDGDPGATGSNNRMFLEAVLCRVRTGSPWRDLPGEFGKWNTVFKRFRRWVKNEVFESLFKVISAEPDFEYALIDGTIVQAHQKTSGAKGGLKIRPSGVLAGDCNQDCGAGRCAWQPCALSASARSGARPKGRSPADSGCFLQVSSGRQGLRRGLVAERTQ